MSSRSFGRFGAVGLAVLVAGCAASPARRAVPVRVSADVDPQSRHRLAQRVWGLDPSLPAPAIDSAALAARERSATAQGPQGPRSAPSSQQPQGPKDDPDLDLATLRARFGATILVAPDGTITKQYFLTGSAGQVFLNLLREPAEVVPPPKPGQPAAFGPARIGGDSESLSVIGRMLGAHEVEVFYLPKFEEPEGVVITPGKKGQPAFDGSPPALAKAAPNNLLLVSAKPESLAAFESALNLFFASIPQIEIEVKVVEFTTTHTLAFGVDQIDSGATPPLTPTLGQLESGKLIGDIVSRFPLVAPSVVGSELEDRGILTLGGIHDGWELNARIEALEARGVADVLSSPRLVVRNGGTASIETSIEFPYPKARITSSGQNVTASIEFRPVGILLNIRPVIAGTETVILQVFASVSAVTSFAETDPVDTPVVVSREAVTSVHVANGKTTVIGGLVSQRTIEQVSQIPILGDIPILGFLFRSTATLTDRTVLEFHITPRIIRAGGGFIGP